MRAVYVALIGNVAAVLFQWDTRLSLPALGWADTSGWDCWACAGTTERVFRRPRVADPELVEEIDQSPRQTHEVGSKHGVIELCDQRVHDGATNGARQHRGLHQ